MHFCYNQTIQGGKISPTITRQITQKDINNIILLLTKTIAAQSSQEALMNSTSKTSSIVRKRIKYNKGWKLFPLNNKFPGFHQVKHKNRFNGSKPYSTLSYEHLSILILGGLKDCFTFVSA